MDTPTDTIELLPNRVVNRSVARLTITRLLAPEDAPGPSRGAEIVYNIDDVDHRIEVNVGETFTVADQVWRLDSVRDELDFAATISRVS